MVRYQQKRVSNTRKKSHIFWWLGKATLLTLKGYLSLLAGIENNQNEYKPYTLHDLCQSAGNFPNI